MLVRAVATITSFTMLSRVLGYVRDAAMAKVLGAGMLSDVFLIAFKIPNFFRRLLAEGAFNAAFVPLFAKRYTGEGADDARRFAGEALTLLLLLTGTLVLVFELYMPALVRIIAPGYNVASAEFALSVDLTRITFPYILLVSLVALAGGVLNTLHKFKYAAFSPTLLNLIMIASLYAFHHSFATPAHGLALGVVLGGVAQLALMVFALWRHAMLFWPRWKFLSDQTRRLLRLLLPGMLGAGVFQINVLVDTMLATYAGEGAVSYLYYADRINQLPLGSIGVALGTALLPLLSAQLRRDELAAAKDTFNHSIRIGMFIALPCTAALLVLSTPIIDVLFRRGAFTVEDAVATANTLKAFAIGLPAYILAKITTAPFFAQENTKTPVKIAAVCVLANLIMNLIFMQFLSYVGIALATALSAWLNVFLLHRVLHRHYGWGIDAPTRRFVARIGLASVALAIVGGGLYAATKHLHGFHDGSNLERLAILCGLCGSASLAFIISVHALGVGSVRSLLRQFKKQPA
jgi:putative peptidoglycan lipid II flippase